MSKRMKVDPYESSCYDPRRSSTTFNNASCELNDDYLIEQFLAINEKCGKCVDVYKKYPSIIENEKTAYAYTEKTLRAQLENTRVEIETETPAVVDQKVDMTWKFLQALERTKLMLVKGSRRP